MSFQHLCDNYPAIRPTVSKLASEGLTEALVKDNSHFFEYLWTCIQQGETIGTDQQKTMDAQSRAGRIRYENGRVLYCDQSSQMWHLLASTEPQSPSPRGPRLRVNTTSQNAGPSSKVVEISPLSSGAPSPRPGSVVSELLPSPQPQERGNTSNMRQPQHGRYYDPPIPSSFESRRLESLVEESSSSTERTESDVSVWSFEPGDDGSRRAEPRAQAAFDYRCSVARRARPPRGEGHYSHRRGGLF